MTKMHAAVVDAVAMAMVRAGAARRHGRDHARRSSTRRAAKARRQRTSRAWRPRLQSAARSPCLSVHRVACSLPRSRKRPRRCSALAFARSTIMADKVRPIATFTSKCQSSCTREREVLARQTGAKATSLPQQQYKQQQTGISTMHALVLRFPPPPSFFFSSKICNKSCSCFLLPLGLGFLLFEQSHFLPPSLSLSHAHTHTHSLSLSLLAWLN